MTRLALIRQLLQHSAWADDALLGALTSSQGVSGEAWREYTHILGAAEVWLSRLERRESRLGVWPTLTPPEFAAFKEKLRSDYAELQARLTEEDVDRIVAYKTTDGRSFTNTVGDILVHVALHGQYHRGKVNLLLRQAEISPAPVDLIAFVRGAPTATQASAAAPESPTSSQH
jgi:uncharacterized damage-inducible protein DinB